MQIVLKELMKRSCSPKESVKSYLFMYNVLKKHEDCVRLFETFASELQEPLQMSVLMVTIPVHINLSHTASY